jgi:hypothetical protein
MRAYLCGAIEYSPDNGRAWRARLAPFFREIGHQWYDPAEDERKCLTDEEMTNFRAWKTSDIARFQRVVRKIIHFDLDIIEEQTDYIVAYWDEHATKGAGTQAELTIAFRNGTPVYLVMGMPREKISGWVLGCATEIFEDFESLRSFLREKGAPRLAEQGKR